VTITLKPAQIRLWLISGDVG